jgi:hypothetical protein
VNAVHSSFRDFLRLECDLYVWFWDGSENPRKCSETHAVKVTWAGLENIVAKAMRLKTIVVYGSG